MSPSRPVGGALTVEALARLHFHTLTRQQQRTAIRNMIAAGQGTQTAAYATGLSIEAIEEILTEADS